VGEGKMKEIETHMGEVALTFTINILADDTPHKKRGSELLMVQFIIHKVYFE
jgi:hypothetical protein